MDVVYVYYNDIALYYYYNEIKFGFRTISKNTFDNRLHELKCELLLNFSSDIKVCPLDTAYKYDHLKAIIICDEQIIRKLKN